MGIEGIDLSSVVGISFDLWLTLIKPNPQSAEYRAKILAEFFGVRKDAPFARLMKDVSLELDGKSEKSGVNYSCLDRVNLLAQRLGLELPQESAGNEIVHLIQQGVRDFPPSLINPDTLDIFRTLVGRGIKLVLISNTGYPEAGTMRRVLSELGIDGFFSSMIFSSEVGYAKPNSRMFERACSDVGAERHQMLHVGDSLQADYFGALACGIDALWFGSDKPELVPESYHLPSISFLIN